MDHKGPERHYDELESPENGRSIFWQQGEVAPDHVNNNGELHGEGRPYRSQPNPVEDDMDRYRDMPLDGASDDEGGNQFRTDKGILANLKKDEEDLEELDEATEPKGLGDIDPVKDNEWASGEITSRPARDEMLGSVRHAGEEESEDKMWDEVIEDFENATGGEMEDSTEKVAAASWLENDGQDSNIPVEQLGWDIVDVVEPSKELTEAANKYSMPLPKGITDNLHEALIKLNAWVGNPEENGKLRPYKDYWSAIRPKVSADSAIQIGVEDPHMADIINDVARTDSLSALSKTAMNKESWSLALRAAPLLTRGLGAGGAGAEAGAMGGVMKGALGAGRAYMGLQGFGDLAGGLLGGGSGDQQQMPIEQAPADFGVTAHNHLSDRYRVPESEIYGEGPMKRIPVSPAEAQLEEAIEQQAPTGYKAYPSGHGEPAGTRGPGGRILPRSEQQPAGDQIWNDPNMPDSEEEWRSESEQISEIVEPAKRPQQTDSDDPPAYKQYQKLDPKYKALTWGRGAWDVGKNLLAQPNKELQTKGVDQLTRGGESFGVIGKTATYGDHYEHPSSVERNEDPENGKLFPSTRTQTVDGPLGDQEWQRDYTEVNEIGQSRDIRGDDYEKHNLKRQIVKGKNDNSKEISKAVEQFINFFPLIMEYFDSEESGMDDPIIRSVHEGLESEFPGYLDQAIPHEENPILIMLQEENNKKESAAPGFTVNQQPAVAGPQPLPTPSMGINGTCPKCGNDMGPDQVCQQCTPDTARAFTPAPRANITHTPELNITGRTASDTQGPHTDEQQAAVAEMLIEQGREDEIPSMLQNPADYDNELAEIQNKDPMLAEDPDDIGMSPQEQMEGMGAPGMPGMDGGMPGMPPGPPGPAPGIPDMGAPTPADLNPAGPGAMQPPVMASMLHAAFKYGADNVAGKCPKCDGHTTKMLQQDGVSKCHSCNHEWQDDTYQKADGDSSHSTTTSSFYQSLNLDEGPETVMPSPVDTFSEPEEEIEIDDSSHTWTDESGEPLQEGKEYEIYAHDYEIPDVGRVKEIKPDAVVYEIESDGGLRTTIEIDRQEADLNGYTFAPTSGASDESNESTTFGIEDKIAPEPGQTTDLSTPHIQIGSSVKESISLTWTCPQQNCQFNAEGGDIEPGTCPYHDVPLEQASTESMRSIHEELSDQRMQDAAQADLRTFTHVAGKHYTPMEQRELIDEYGEARNADKLNLEGTHYADSDPDYFLFGC